MLLAGAPGSQRLRAGSLAPRPVSPCASGLGSSPSVTGSVSCRSQQWAIFGLVAGKGVFWLAMLTLVLLHLSIVYL